MCHATRGTVFALGRSAPMFEGFTLKMIEVSGATLRVRYGGRGKPLLLLHGHPRTHATWHRVAATLAPDYFVVCPDLHGFGQSSIPADTPNHSGSSKRAKALDCIELMQRLGVDRFSVAGHDRGSYTAFRLAMDQPEAVERLIILDGVPIIEALERCNAHFAKAWWHWFFFAQLETPERVINADPEAWYKATSQYMGDDAFADFLDAIHNPQTVHGMLKTTEPA